VQGFLQPTANHPKITMMAAFVAETAQTEKTMTMVDLQLLQRSVQQATSTVAR